MDEWIDGWLRIKDIRMKESWGKMRNAFFNICVREGLNFSLSSTPLIQAIHQSNHPALWLWFCFKTDSLIKSGSHVIFSGRLMHIMFS
jgi:hypothetical protein